MITNIDANGRVQLPLTIRYWLDLCPGDKIAVDHLGDGTIILKKIERSVSPALTHF
ncbi:MAG: AbrB/MazE/SpoVT family DNA-binding domain-containing protein [Methanothrix sp.]|nr:AbrB/MazE/SpoVT family DNA-binding domain-containing protein [Methanothrix sp.]